MPVMPRGGPLRRPNTSASERSGPTAETPRTRTRQSGYQLYRNAGDWLVVNGGGRADRAGPEFRDSHEPLGGDFWLRCGNYRAWQVSQAVVLWTREGRATALLGEWVTEGARGESWPLTDEQFPRSYTAPAAPWRLRIRRGPPGG